MLLDYNRSHHKETQVVAALVVLHSDMRQCPRRTNTQTEPEVNGDTSNNLVLHELSTTTTHNVTQGQV